MTTAQRACLEWIRDNSPTTVSLFTNWRVEIYHPLRMRGHVTIGATWEITAAGTAALGQS